MNVSVVYALPEEQTWLPVVVEENATLMTAIHISGLLNMFPDIDLEKQKVGIFGKTSDLEATLSDGDRVEIYRPTTWVEDEDDDDD
ncbi:protein RnfH [Vibrio sp. 10N.286.49.B3]|uniref:RnfH family protein n=1 Tax=Vibrio sp. 10N.286.49.B3 TaxID=1880855 RepID=UPI000C81D900|nr:RnfH family protein [Vibrio sp. 10N.286.49.B3]PMH44861.1 protein RnfH [Vibrio sp. 10N.286.49.B3]